LKKQTKKIRKEEFEMKQSNPQVFTLDLSRIDGKGDFPCPCCGVSISPDDESDNIYSIVDTKVNGDTLEELVIVCNKCGSKIRLTGFLKQD
jgi:uncharacterized membrane protein